MPVQALHGSSCAARYYDRASVARRRSAYCVRSKAHKLDDPALLDRAKELGRVLFTRDDDLLAEAARRQEENISFPAFTSVKVW